MTYGFDLQILNENGWKTLHVFTPENRSKAWELGRELLSLDFCVAFKVERLWRS